MTANRVDMRDPAKGPVPMKASAFQSLGEANSQLMPLFPYLHPGAIVPCVAGFETDGSNRSIGYFIHKNTVDEVALAVGGNGPFRPGDVFVGAKEHGVGRSPAQAFFSLMVITQRQLEAAAQPEEVAFQCDNCGNELFREGIDGEAPSAGAVAELPTTILSAAAATHFNEDEARRTCSGCGKVNAPFPLPIWGWDRYVRNMRVARKAWAALEEAGQ